MAAREVAQAGPRWGHAERIAVSVKDATESSRIPVYSPASAPTARSPAPAAEGARGMERRRAGSRGRKVGEGGKALKWADGHLRYELAMAYGWDWVSLDGQDQMGRDLAVHLEPVQVHSFFF